jgi:hypothetical protein
MNPDTEIPTPLNPWKDDAPDGKVWECPDCGCRAILAGNAGYHRDKYKHREPVLKDFIKPPSELQLLRSELTTKTAELAAAREEISKLKYERDRWREFAKEH